MAQFGRTYIPPRSSGPPPWRRVAADVPVTVTAQVATLTLTGVQTAPALTALSVTAQTGTVVLTGVQPAVTLTALAVTAQVATLTLSGVTSGIGVRYMGESGFLTSTFVDFVGQLDITADVPVGRLLVLHGALDNAGVGGTATTVSVLDTAFEPEGPGTNTWTVITPHAIADPGATNAGVAGFFAYTVVEWPLVAGVDSVYILPTDSVTAGEFAVHQWYNADPTAPVLASSYATQDNQTGQSVSVGTGTAPTTAGQVVLAIVPVEGDTGDAFTQDTDTTNGTWTTLTRRSAGTGTAGVTLNQAYKFVTAAGAQTYDHATMLGTARDHAAAVLILSPAGTASPVTVTAQVATLTLSGVQPAVTLTGITVTAQTATLSLSAVTSGGTLTGLTVTAQRGAIVLTGLSSGGTLTALTVTAQRGAITLTGITSAGTLTAITVTAQTGTVVLSGIPGTPVVEGGPVTVTAQTAVISLSATAGTTNLTGLTHGAQTGVLTLTGVQTAPSLTGITVTAQRGSLTLSAVSAAAAGSGLTVTAQPAVLTLTAQSGTVTLTALTVTAQRGVLVLTGVSAGGALFVDAGNVPRITSHAPGRIRSETAGRIRSRQPDLVTSGV